MTAITITEIVEAVETTLETATGINRTESGVALTEGIPDTPLLQVYWESEETDITNAGDRTTFGAGVRQSEIVVHADVYAHERGELGENIALVQTLAEAVRAKLAAQNTKPYFGLDGLKAFHWRAERVTFEYAAVKYAGIRFILTFRVF